MVTNWSAVRAAEGGEGEMQLRFAYIHILM